MSRLVQIILAVVLVGVMLAGPASAAPADTVVGNGTLLSCTEGALGAALVVAGTITFNCGGPATIAVSGAWTVGQDTTLDGGDLITLDGGFSTRLFVVNSGATLTLRHIVLDQAASAGSDGGAIVNHGNLILDHATIQHSQTDSNHSGGAIFSDGPVTITSSLLRNNTGGSAGALFANFSKAVVTISNSTFSGNQAVNTFTGYGGAIWVGAHAQVAITGGAITNNTAQFGGGLYVDQGATVTVNSAGAPAIVSSNSVTGAGGGLYNSLGSVTLTNVRLQGNSALADGGAISNIGGTLTLEGADLSFNQTLTTSVTYGGAIDDEGVMFVDNSTFNTNQGRYGGAVFVGGHLFNAQADIQHTLFIANIAAQFGGALYANTFTTTVTIEDSNFEFNRASTGGGISRFDAHLSISKSSITSNTGLYGGGLGLLAGPNPTDGPYVEIHDSTISSNLSISGYGGGINNTGLLDLVNVTLADNRIGHDPSADDAGLYDVLTGTIARLQNSVLDNPAGINCFGDFGAGAPSSSGFNYATDTSCGLSGFHDTQGNELSVMLGTLTHANSFTDYQMPQPGSPLINAAGPGCSPTDQIYALRNGACDIGAVEFDGLLPRIFAPLILK